MKLSTLLANTALIASSLVAAEVDPIVIKGTKFFYKSNGTEFFMKGVAYQQEWAGNGTSGNKDKYVDPLADVDACKRDVPLLQELNTNTIRVYAINPKEDHKECMNLLEEAGIYVVADLGEPATSINRDDPKWDDILYERYTSVIDELAPYNNVIGFFAGNEVTNNKTNTGASAYVKASVRDMKSYIKKKNYRTMGVGYATNDDADVREDMTDYFNCNSRDEAIDFWGYNIYSWCGDSSYKKSGYDAVVKQFKDFNVPMFFAEYGCNAVQPRKFTEVEAIYGDEMTPVLSGGIVYMYFQEDNDYGLVELKGDKAKKLPDFNNLKKQLGAIDPKTVKMDDYKPTNAKLRSCPDSKSWKASKDLPPTPNKDLCSCMVKSLTCVASKDIKDKEIGDLFGEVCGMDKEACNGISGDPSKGSYGAYSMCSPKEKLSHAFDTYYQKAEKAGNGDDACDFDGSATKQSPSEAKGECKSLMEEAGPEGTGTVTSSPNSDGGSGSGDDPEESSSAARPMALPAMNLGLLQLGAYLFCAVTAGASMILM